MKNRIFVLLYYKFVEVKDPAFETMQHKYVCDGLGLKGRVIIAQEGINGTVAGNSAQLKKYIDYMDKHPLFDGIVFKRSYSGKMPFGKMIVKHRDEIVTLGKKIDISNTGTYLKPSELHELFENDEDMVVVDMRNNYEYDVGRFEGAIQPDTTKFYELPSKIKNFKIDKDKKIVTYCTGGIRCEKATVLLKEIGYENVYQLEGGIVKYLEKYPDGYFKGKNFVFDNRMVTNVDTPSGKEVLSKCEHCRQSCDRYIDCTDTKCHRLFICCKDCEKKHSGFCRLSSNKTIKK